MFALPELIRTAWRDTIFDHPPDDQVLRESVLDKYPLAVLAVAIRELGNGERGVNNAGPDVMRYLAPLKKPQPWCAALGCFELEHGAIDIGIKCPVHRSYNAKTLGKNIVAFGHSPKHWTLLQPGDFIIRHRCKGPKDSHLGHFQTVEWRSLQGVGTIEGNVGQPGKALVARFQYKPLELTDFNPKDGIAFFASLRKAPQ